MTRFVGWIVFRDRPGGMEPLRDGSGAIQVFDEHDAAQAARGPLDVVAPVTEESLRAYGKRFRKAGENE